MDNVVELSNSYKKYDYYNSLITKFLFNVYQFLTEKDFSKTGVLLDNLISSYNDIAFFIEENK